MDVGAAFVADTEPAVLVEPGDRALDDPALTAEPGAVWKLRQLLDAIPDIDLSAPRA